MAGRLILTAVACALLLTAGAGRAARGAQCAPAKQGCFELVSTIAFGSNRDTLTVTPVADGAEIYLMNADGSNVRRLTDNVREDAFPNLSPDGKKIVFDSDRLSGQVNVSDLYWFESVVLGPTFLTRGSSATWSPNGKEIAFHASASGSGTPVRTNPGSATTDSDLFVVDVDDLLAGVATPTDITNSADKVDDDADWSSAGRLVYSAHDVGDDPPAPPFTSNSAEIYTIAPDGSDRLQLTDNSEEERAPNWSPDATRIVYQCRIGGGRADFELCVMNADGSGVQQLTSDSVTQGGPSFSPDGQQIVFNIASNQLFTINAQLNPDGTRPTATQLTFPSSLSAFAHWGLLRVLLHP